MKKVKTAAKKGIILILMSVILFVATSIVAVLSTVIVISRNQVIEFEYTSRTKIALRSKVNDVYEAFLDLVPSQLSGGLSVDDATRTVVTVLGSTEDVNLVKDVNLTLYRDKTNKNIYYFSFNLNRDYFSEEEREHMRSGDITARIDYNTTLSDSLNPANYKLTSVKYFKTLEDGE